MPGADRIRPAEPGEARAVADLWLAARRAAGSLIPPGVHSDHEVRDWYQEVVFATREVWVIGGRGQPQAMMVLHGDWIEQLYVDPRHQRTGLGSRLVAFAQRRRTELRLHTFVSNLHARAFYEKHGFSADGPPSSDNEEGAPALVYRWRAR